MRKIILNTIFLLNSFAVINGQIILPLNPHFSYGGNSYFENQSLYPVFRNQSLNATDSMVNSFVYNPDYKPVTWFGRKLRTEHLMMVRENNFELNVDPLALLELGYENGREIKRNTRGIMLQATIGGNIGFFSTFHENQSSFMGHVQQFAEYYGVVPGQAFQKPFKVTRYDYAWSEGMLYWNINKKINLQFGHGKRFVGNGYRSMLYADNSFNYPHLFLQFKHEKIEYSSWFTSFMNVDVPHPQIILNKSWPRKAGVFHYLSFKPNSHVELSGFEANIISSRKIDGKYVFSPMHFNPLMYLNLLDKNSNSYLGTNISGNYKGTTLYIQYILDPRNISKSGFQAGAAHLKYLNRAYMKLNAEIDHAARGLYAYSDPLLSYTHYSQPLAHPLGENFTEFVFNTIFNMRLFELEYKFNYATSNSDTLGYLPALNLYFPDDIVFSTGNKSIRKIHEIKLSYVINPHYNVRLTLGVFLRNFTYPPFDIGSKYVYVSFQTPVFNKYYDF